jgi:hypothetical protein
MDGRRVRCVGGAVRFLVFAAVLVLAGCQHKLTLEEAQALCEKQGGFLVVIYTQKITASGPGEQVASPGDCLGTDKYGIAAPGAPPGAIK